LRHKISNLAKFADEINEEKFQKLSSKKQHELIGSYAYFCLKNNAPKDFFKKYEIFHSWAELDRFCPGNWLNDNEKLKAYYEFHISYSINPPENDLDENAPIKSQWNPVFDLSIFIDEIRSPYNIGSILRIADNFGLKGVYHSSSHINISNPKLKKASMGTYRWIPLVFVKDPVSWLLNSKKEIVALETGKDSQNISDWVPIKNSVIVAGNEENGISEKILSCCTKKIHIPMYGFKKSLNVSNAVSVICHKYIEGINK
jgi:tRNA G18 (ribose-2'-O)-methylase SpoU